jgi:curved DNA-binding protein
MKGPRSGASGDLYLIVHLKPDPRYKVDGSDLHTSLEIMPWVAALGGTARLSTLEGEVRLKIPPGSSTGRRIRLRGRGLNRPRGGRGDLYAEIRVVVPKQLTAEQRALFERLAATVREHEPVT